MQKSKGKKKPRPERTGVRERKISLSLFGFRNRLRFPRHQTATRVIHAFLALVLHDTINEPSRSIFDLVSVSSPHRHVSRRTVRIFRNGTIARTGTRRITLPDSRQRKQKQPTQNQYTTDSFHTEIYEKSPNYPTPRQRETDLKRKSWLKT